MYTHLANCILQLSCISEHITNLWLIAVEQCAQIVHILVAVLQIHFRRFTFLVFYIIWETFLGYKTFYLVHACERNALHTPHIRNSRFGSHRAVGNNMCHLRMAVFLTYPIQHFATSSVVKVSINIGQRNTIRIQETLKQQVVLQWVKVRDSQAVCHHRSCCTTTTRAYTHAQFLSSCANKVHHNQEVTWETHSLHDMQLKFDSLLLLFGQRLAIALMCTFVCQVSQIIGF